MKKRSKKVPSKVRIGFEIVTSRSADPPDEAGLGRECMLVDELAYMEFAVGFDGWERDFVKQPVARFREDLARQAARRLALAGWDTTVNNMRPDHGAFARERASYVHPVRQGKLAYTRLDGSYVLFAARAIELRRVNFDVVEADSSLEPEPSMGPTWNVSRSDLTTFTGVFTSWNLWLPAQSAVGLYQEISNRAPGRASQLPSPWSVEVNLSKPVENYWQQQSEPYIHPRFRIGDVHRVVYSKPTSGSDSRLAAVRAYQ